MSPELLQILWYFGFAVLGWYLRHKGWFTPSLPGTPGPAPALPGGHVSGETILDLLKAVLEKVSVPPQQPPAK